MSKVTWNYLTIAAGCWMLGEGARMVVMGLFYKDHWYNPNLFDIFFDWLPMVVIGLVFLSFGIREFYIIQKKKQMERAEAINAFKRVGRKQSGLGKLFHQ